MAVITEDDWGARDPAWTGIRSAFIPVNDVSVHVLRADPPADTPVAATLPVLLVHGLGGAATNWLEVMGHLARDRPVVAVDLPGFAETRPPTPRAARMAPQVKFLVRLLDELGWDQAEVHGNSMGGLLSILLAGQHPERVRRLVLAAPAFPLGDLASAATMDLGAMATLGPFLASRRLGLFGLRRLYARATPEDLVANTEGLVLGGGQLRPPLRQVGLEHAHNALDRPWRAASLGQATTDMLRLLAGRRRALAAARAITADILLVWGSQDRLVSQASVDNLTTVRGDLTRRDIPGVGHVPMIEAPDRYLQVVDDWRATITTADDASSRATPGDPDHDHETDRVASTTP